MSTRRTSVVWSPGTGWVRKMEKEPAQYESLGEGWIFLMNFIRWFPDFLLDLYHGEKAEFDLTLIQRVFIRAMARYQNCDITACRGATKSFCTIGEKGVEQLVWPGVTISYVGPSFKQTAAIGSKIYKSLQANYPGMMDLFRLIADSKDRFEFGTDYGSNLYIAAFRGDTVHENVAEEYAQEAGRLGQAFDFEEYKQVILPAVRGQYRYGKAESPTFIKAKKQTITSAGRRQNHSYETRCKHLNAAGNGKNAFVIDVPYDVVLLCGMRPVEWAENLRQEMTPDEWDREMESIYTGAEEDCIISDAALTESRCLLTMEEHHCCKDAGCKLKPEDVIYVIGYDVSYKDSPINAKCAAVVLKLTRQTEFLKRDKYLKQAVWIEDWSPTDADTQALRLKSLWFRFSFESSQTYIALDAWQYGTAVLESLMKDLGDGINPLCTFGHTIYTEYEREGALPVIYPVKAGGVGTTDPDAEMVRNCEIQFSNHNVQLLTANYAAGVDAYKNQHRIKDNRSDARIYQPYKKTQEMVGQIQNLKKVPSASGFSEKRISNRIQRDSWSAFKYALRFAQLLERANLSKKKEKSAWEVIYKAAEKTVGVPHNMKLRGGGYVGGRRV